MNKMYSANDEDYYDEDPEQLAYDEFMGGREGVVEVTEAEPGRLMNELELTQTDSWDQEGLAHIMKNVRAYKTYTLDEDEGWVIKTNNLTFASPGNIAYPSNYFLLERQIQ